MDPKVTFIVPCYKLANLLPECVNSILAQSYRDFEVLIMDDCSPDNTPEVARSFTDPRVRHIRNEPNLGHLRNYNKGISLARGKYVWIISADDKLRQPYILQRYVDLMESHDKVGYVFCTGMALEDGRETEIIQGCAYGDRDMIVDGRRFVLQILNSDGILAASIMVRKECYTKVADFPLDMPHRADIYLWALFALHYDVAYMAEPMVSYRIHAVSMMQTFIREKPWIIMADDLNVLRAIKDRARELRLQHVVDGCLELLGRQFAGYVLATMYERRANRIALTAEECEQAIVERMPDAAERNAVRAGMYTAIADEHRWHGDTEAASHCYGQALSLAPFKAKTWSKFLLAQVARVRGGRKACPTASF